MQFISPPEASEATQTRPKTAKSFMPCTRPRSSGVCAAVSIAVAPMKPKFQPRPSRISATEKCPRVTPERPTAPAAARSARPAAMTRSAPKRAIRLPVKNDGANMASTCQETTSAALAVEKPQPTTASGVEVITRFISA